MKTFELEIRPVKEPPEEAGWYLTWDFTEKPRVLWGNPGQTEWRDFMTKTRIEFWAGPLPTRSRK